MITKKNHNKKAGPLWKSPAKSLFCLNFVNPSELYQNFPDASSDIFSLLVDSFLLLINLISCPIVLITGSNIAKPTKDCFFDFQLVADLSDGTNTLQQYKKATYI